MNNLTTEGENNKDGNGKKPVRIPLLDERTSQVSFSRLEDLIKEINYRGSSSLGDIRAQIDVLSQMLQAPGIDLLATACTLVVSVPTENELLVWSMHIGAYTENEIFRTEAPFNKEDVISLCDFALTATQQVVELKTGKTVYINGKRQLDESYLELVGSTDLIDLGTRTYEI